MCDVIARSIVFVCVEFRIGYTISILTRKMAIEKVEEKIDAIMSSESDGSERIAMTRYYMRAHKDKGGRRKGKVSYGKRARRDNSMIDHQTRAHERSCGAIVFEDMEGALHVLMIQHRAGHWSFPKGHMEKGESEHETAIREVREETGIEIEIVSDFRGESTYSPRRGVSKTVTFFIGSCLGGVIRPQEGEVCAVHWMRAVDAVRLLTFDKDRAIFLNAFEHYLKHDCIRAVDCRHREKIGHARTLPNAFTLKERYTVDELLAIMAFLRSDEGCPWDRVQTHESIKGNLIEEAYEAVDAIRQKDNAKLCEELGDVMMQVVFHAQMAKEAGNFTFDDVVSGICRKLISRHSHLFGDDVATTPHDVLDTWEKNKREEKGHDSIIQELQDVPISFPALMRSFKLQKRAARIGFDWSTIDGAREKIVEETDELFDEVNKAMRDVGSEGDLSKTFERERIFNEGGDLLFAVVNVLRMLEIDPESALNATSEKFIRRFIMMDELARENNQVLEEMSLDEMDQLWNKVKENERNKPCD